MGNVCQNTHQTTTQVLTQEQESFIKEETFKVIHNMNPNIKKDEYLLENLDEGIGVSTITAIIIKPKNQAQVLEILRGIRNVETEVRYNSYKGHIQLTPSSLNDSKRSTRENQNSEKHVHFQIPNMKIVENEKKYRKKCVKR